MAEGKDNRLDRLVAFSDAVFAFAITLLVLDIHVPDLPRGSSDAAWRTALLAIWPHALSFLISFFVIGRMWIAHHGLFALVSRYDPRLMWPALLLLLAVVFMPFATGLLSAGNNAALPYAVYCAVLLFASGMKAWLTQEALRPDTLAPGVSTATVKAERRSCWLMPAAAALSLALAFVTPGWNMLGLLLMSFGRRLALFDPAD